MLAGVCLCQRCTPSATSHPQHHAVNQAVLRHCLARRLRRGTPQAGTVSASRRPRERDRRIVVAVILATSRQVPRVANGKSAISCGCSRKIWWSGDPVAPDARDRVRQPRPSSAIRRWQRNRAALKPGRDHQEGNDHVRLRLAGRGPGSVRETAGPKTNPTAVADPRARDARTSTRSLSAGSVVNER
jgi:hypothetical protein